MDLVTEAEQLISSHLATVADTWADTPDLTIEPAGGPDCWVEYTYKDTVPDMSTPTHAESPKECTFLFQEGQEATTPTQLVDLLDEAVDRGTRRIHLTTDDQFLTLVVAYLTEGEAA